MLRRGCVLRSGHGDLFPTSKAAAHLDVAWVMWREVPHAPGKGHCYADFTTPAHHSPYQALSPEVHERKVISTVGASAHELHHCTTERPSDAAIAATIAGVASALDTHHHRKTNDTPMARANIAAKRAAEERAKTRDFMAHKRTPLMQRPPQTFPKESQSYSFMEDRVNQLRKIENSNQNGYVRDYMPWEAKPPPPPPPQKK